MLEPDGTLLFSPVSSKLITRRFLNFLITNVTLAKASGVPGDQGNKFQRDSSMFSKNGQKFDRESVL